MHAWLTETATVVGGDRRAQRERVWINGWKWDLAWLIGSCAIVPIVLLFVWSGAPASWIGIGVTAIVGGPHLFATYTATFMDPRFRRSHGWLLIVAGLGVPAFVVYLTLANFQVLLSIFIFAASFHVLHQNAYLTDVYRARAGLKEAPTSRLIDYGLLMLCIYPIAAYKLVTHRFMLGDVEILIPSVLATPATYWSVWIAFAFFLVAWIVKSFGEARERTLNVPKTVLIGVTSFVAFFAPAAADGERMELAFQAVNAWHSIQYLGIVWLTQNVRKDRGLIESPFVRAISGPGRPAGYFYGFCTAVTGMLFCALLGLHALHPFRMPFQHYYYMGILSCLLVHYVLDAYLFAVSARLPIDLARSPYSASIVVVS